MEKSPFKFPLQVRGDAALTTPRIDEVLTQFRQRIASEAVTDLATQPDHQSFQPGYSAVTDLADPANEERIRKLEHQVSRLIQQVPIKHCTLTNSWRSICMRFGIQFIKRSSY